MSKTDNIIMFGVFTIISFMFLFTTPVLGAIMGCYFIGSLSGVIVFFIVFPLTAYPHLRDAIKIHEQIEREFGVIEENFNFREEQK